MAIGAFGKKYFVPFQVQGGYKREIQIFASGYSAPPIEWKGGSKPWTIEKGAADDLFDGLIVSSVATIEVLLEERFDFTEFLTSRQSHLVNLVNTDTDEIMWSGWVEPHDGNSPYSKPPHTMVFKASCGLAQLKRIKWQQPVAEVVRKPVIEIVRRCLFLTGHSLNLNTSVFAAEEVMPPGDPLAGYRINTDRYYDGTVRLYAYDILADILEKHNAEIFQERNEWVIRSLPDQTRGYTNKRRYAPDGSSLGMVAQELDYRINTDQAVSLSTGNRSALRPIKKWSASANLLPYTNPFQNGDLRNWDGTTFPSWNLAPMAGNWSKFDTGNPKTPFAIKITGFKPVQEIVRAKTNFWGRTKITHVEPARYIESPQLIFNAQEEKTTITIPYRLEARIDPEQLSLLVAVWTERENGTDRIWLQQDGKWGNGWDGVPFKGGTSLQDKEPVEARLEVDTRSLNKIANWVPSSQLPSPYKILHVRIYQVIGYGGYPGVDMLELKIYGIYVNKTDNTFTGPTTVGYTINANSTVEDDSKAVQLLTAEVHGNHLTGITLDLNNDINTARWSRPGFVDERRSLLGLMIFERIALTSHPLKVMSVEIKVLPEQPDLLFENFLIFNDAGEERFKIVRYQYIEHSRTAKITAVEIKYLVPEGLTGMSQIGDQTSFDNNGTGEVSEIVEGTTGTGTKPVEDDLEGEKVVLDTENITIEFIVAEENEEEIDIPDVLGIETEDLEGLTFDVISKPTWLTIEVSEDGVWTLTGIPPQSGSFTAIYTVTDEFEDISTGKIIITVEPSEDFIESWPPKFIEVPPFYFIAGKTATKELLLSDYLDPDGEHDGIGLNPRLLSTPYWVTDSRIVFMNLSATGTPDKPGTYWITYELSDAIGRTTTLAFEVIVLDPSFLTYELLDTSGATPVFIGNLPGVYELPLRWDVAVRIKGDHDYYKIFLKGGGANAGVVNRSLEENVLKNDDGDYRFFLEDNGVVTEAGQFSLSADTYLAKNFIFGETIDFVLYDEEFLEAIKFFLVKGGVELGELVQDGTSSFIDPETGNFKIDVDGIEHDKAILYFDLVTPVTVLHKDGLGDPEPVTEFSYQFWSVDSDIAVYGHQLKIELFLEGEKVSTRYVNFETVPTTPKPTKGLSLVKMVPNTTDQILLGELPETGGSFELPDNWNVISDAESPPYDFEKAEIWELRGGGLVKIEVPVYTGQPDYTLFATPVTMAKTFLFRELNSLKIGNVHSTPSTFRVIFTRRIGGATGTVVAILKSDFSFGPAVDIDDTPITLPGQNVVDYLAGDGLEEYLEDFRKTFSVRVDNATIEIFPTQNWLRVKDKGITYSKFQDIAGLSLVGRTAGGEGVSAAVPIVTDLLTASNSNIPTALAVKNATSAIKAVSLNLTGYTNESLSATDADTIPVTSSLLSGGFINTPIAGGFLSTIIGTSGSFVQTFLGHGVQDAFYFRRKLGATIFAWEQVASRSHVLATYAPLVRTLTVGGTAGRITATGGAQSLAVIAKVS